MSFRCSICEQESMRICVCCTKDACSNHLCERCERCSDCCECEFTGREAEPPTVRASTPPNPDPAPEPPHPPPDPDPGDAVVRSRETGVEEIEAGRHDGAGVGVSRL
jgi:hypothetical protein